MTTYDNYYINAIHTCMRHTAIWLAAYQNLLQLPLFVDVVAQNGEQGYPIFTYMHIAKLYLNDS